MNNKLLSRSLLFLFLLAILLNSYRYFNTLSLMNSQKLKSVEKSLENEIKAIKKILNKNEFYVIDSDNNSIITYNPDNTIKNYFYFSNFISKDFPGYGGPINFLILFDKDKIFKDFILLNHRETPNFIDFIQKKGFFKQFEGLSIANMKSKTFDTVTGATMTSSAILNSTKKILHINNSSKEEKTEYNIFSPILIYIILYLIISYSFIFILNKGKLRFYLSFINLIFSGFYFGFMLSFSAIYNLSIKVIDIYFGTQKLTAILIAFFILFLFSIFLSLLKKVNYYCYFFCPYGFLQELIFKLKKYIKTPSIPSKVLFKLKDICYYYFILILSLNIFSNILSTDILEPFSFFGNFTNLSLSFIAFVFLFMSLFSYRPWCKLFCPTGRIFEMLLRR